MNEQKFNISVELSNLGCCKLGGCKVERPSQLYDFDQFLLPKTTI